MEDYSMGEDDSYQPSPYESENDEPNHDWDEEEAESEAPPWPGDDYSNSEPEEEPDPEDFRDEPYEEENFESESLNYAQDETRTNSSYEEEEGEEDATQESDEGEPFGDSRTEDEESHNHGEGYHKDVIEEDYGEESWCEESEFQNSLEEIEPYDAEQWDDESAPEDSYAYEPESSQDNERRGYLIRRGSGAMKSRGGDLNHEAGLQIHSKSTSSRKQAHKGRVYTSNSLTFSGTCKDPEAYLRWETNMKQWLRSHNIPKEEKLSYALDKLVGDAYTWWINEDERTFYNNPVRDWGDLKARMYREFVRKHRTSHNITQKTKYQTTPKEVMPTPMPQPICKHKYSSHSKHKRVFSNTITNQNQYPDHTKESTTNDLLDLHQQIDRMIHLLLSKEHKKGTGVRGEMSARPKEVSNSQNMSSNSLKERTEATPKEAYNSKPKKVSKNALNKKEETRSTYEPKKSKPNPIQQVVVQNQSINPSLESTGAPELCKSSNLSKSNEVTCYRCHKKGHFAATCPEKRELIKISVAPKLSSPNSNNEVVHQCLEDSNSCVMHLLLSKNVDSGPAKKHRNEKAKGSTKRKEQQIVSIISQISQDKKYEQAAHENSLVIKSYPTSSYYFSKITIYKVDLKPDTLRGNHVTREFIRYWNNFTFIRSFKSVLNVFISSIMHLMYPKGFK